MAMTESTRKRGRKPVPEAEQRRHPVTCRLTDAERDHVDASRGSVTRGEFIRRAALSAPPRVVPEVNRAAWVELARLSANLNQIARHLNEGGAETPAQGQLAELRDAVVRLRADLIGLEVPDGQSER
jgi:hypothetical protein